MQMRMRLSQNQFALYEGRVKSWHSSGGIPLISDIEHLRITLAETTDPKHKSQFGQFFTPAEIARFMAGLFESRTDSCCRLLDAGAGIGSLSAAFLLRWKEGGFDFKCAELDAFEIDEYLLPHLAQTIAEQRETLEISSTIRNADFIVAASDWLSGNFLADPLPTFLLGAYAHGLHGCRHDGRRILSVASVPRE